MKKGIKREMIKREMKNCHKVAPREECKGKGTVQITDFVEHGR
jgi:hypothetical protein